MVQKKYLLASLLAFFAVNGCSDESSGSGTHTEIVPECETGESCASGKCLESGKCAEVAGVNESCDDEHICTGELECKEGVCKEKGSSEPEPGPDEPGPDEPGPDEPGPDDPIIDIEHECEASFECGEGKACSDSRCVDIIYRQNGEACEVGSDAVQCADDLSCYSDGSGNGTCMTQEDIDKIGKCSSDEDCADEAVYKNCIPQLGKCGLWLERGEDCVSDERMVCKDDMSCIGLCIQEVGEGERCVESEGSECGGSLNCIDEVCRNIDDKVKLGGKCNDKWLFCDGDLTCRGDKCVEEIKEDGKCDEAANKLCQNGLACLNGVCAPVGVQCKSTTDCKEKDMFCCLSDSCGAKGRCVPYDGKVTHDDQCVYTTKPGIFEAQIQCRWQPPANDANPASKKVEMHPLVGHFGNKANLKSVVAFWSYNTRYTSKSHDADTAEANKYDASKHLSVIRFINPETCETLESIRVNLDNAWLNYPSAADVDNDGLLELIVINSSGKPVLYKWNKDKKVHEAKWTGNVTTGDIPHIFDIDQDGTPEVVVGTSVLNAVTGEVIFKGATDHNYYTTALGNLDGNAKGNAWLVVGKYVYRWNKTNKNWDKMVTLDTNVRHAAYADFGTIGATANDFNYNKLDGLPEIVTSGGGVLRLYALKKASDGTYSYQKLKEVKYTAPIHSTATSVVGGPITIGDFDSDGLPEIGVASSGFFGVYDPRCTKYEAGKCAGPNVLWERWSQDASSGTTGSSLFDFDGDGQTEAVYADECFTRVYEGKTGKVLFSSKRSSSTSIEGPVIADIDGDGSAEILMGSDNNAQCVDDSLEKINPTKPGTSNAVDPIHEGIRCLDDEDCPTSKNCNKKLGLCTCSSDAECNTQYVIGKDGKQKILQQYVCAPPIHPSVGMMVDTKNSGTRTMVKDIGVRPDGWKEGNYKVCRATRLTTDIGVSDLMIFKDRLDRWVSSRSLWNQHSYNIINVEDNGRVPTMAQWLKNWAATKTGTVVEGTKDERRLYNNYRLNKQGAFGAGTVPDITGRFIAGSICGTTEDGRHVISGKLCNRGTKPVSTKLPATFFYYDDSKADKRGKAICTSYTKSIVGVGECAQVGCEVSEKELDALEGKKVLMVTNLDEHGLSSTVECNSDNNTDSILVESCKTEEIVIVN